MLGCVCIERWIVGLHLLPDRIRHSDTVTIEVERVGRDNVCLGAEADGRTDRLS